MSHLVYAALCLLWIVGVAAGWTFLGQHSAEAGAPAAAPLEVAGAGQAHLMVFAHPRCPCTPASIRTLARMLRGRPGAARITVYMMTPPDADTDWEDTRVWTLAHQLPGATVALDPGGTIARQHGVATSGQVLFYDADGALQFAGGLTPSRGHEGSTAGQQALQRALDALPTLATDTPVYGCSLHDAPSI